MPLAFGDGKFKSSRHGEGGTGRTRELAARGKLELLKLRPEVNRSWELGLGIIKPDSIGANFRIFRFRARQIQARQQKRQRK